MWFLFWFWFYDTQMKTALLYESEKSEHFYYHAWILLCQKLVCIFPCIYLIAIFAKLFCKTKCKFEFPDYSSCCMFDEERLGVWPPGWDASPSQAVTTPRILSPRYPFILLGGERHSESKVPCLRAQHSQWPRPGLEPRPLGPKSNALTIIN